MSWSWTAGLCAVVGFTSNCIAVDEIPLSAGTTVVSYSDSPVSHILGVGSAGLVGSSTHTVAHISHFACPPEFMGLSTNGTVRPGEQHAPSAPTAQYVPLGDGYGRRTPVAIEIGRPYKVEPAVPGLQRTKLIGSVAGGCPQSMIVLGRDDSDQEVAFRAFADGRLQRVDVLLGPVTWASCLGEVSLREVFEGGARAKALYVGEEMVLDLPKREYEHIAVSCSDDPSVILTIIQDKLTTELMHIQAEAWTKKPPQYLTYTSSRAREQLMANPRTPGGFIVSVLYEDKSREAFELDPSGSHQAMSIMTASGPSPVRLARQLGDALVALFIDDGIVLRSSNRDRILQVCSGASHRVVDILSVQGRLLVLFDNGELYDVPAQVDCLQLEGRRLISLYAEGHHLLGLPGQIFVLGPTSRPGSYRNIVARLAYE